MKGISPLVATIMLIALALAVSGIFFSWLSQFTYSNRQELQTCSKARIALQKAYYVPDADNITLLVYNNGDIPLRGFSIVISYSSTSEAVKDFLATEIGKGETAPLRLKYRENIRTILVQSAECRNAQDMVNVHDVQGL